MTLKLHLHKTITHMSLPYLLRSREDLKDYPEQLIQSFIVVPNFSSSHTEKFDICQGLLFSKSLTIHSK